MMKDLKIIWFCLIAVLSSCEPMATFEKPQPDNTKNISRLPEKFVGTYRNSSGDKWFFITSKSVVSEIVYEEKTHKNDLDSSVVLQGNFLLDLGTREKIEVSLVGDSVIHHFNYSDSLLSMAGGDVLKKFKGHYFLNHNYGQNRWSVTSLAYSKGVLIVKSINKPEELYKLKEITNTVSDSCLVFNPTKKQFRQFVKQNGFATKEVYYRVK